MKVPNVLLSRALLIAAPIAGVALASLLLSLIGVRTLGIIETTLLAMTPLVLAATGECLNERAGMVNVALEGIIVISALFSVYWAEVYHSGLMGLVGGVVTGMLAGLMLGVLGTYLKANQIVVGMGLNVAALGLVQYLLMAIWAFPGIHIFPRELMLDRVRIEIFGERISVSPVTFLAIAAAVVAHLLLFRTRAGLWIRAAGDRPEALDVAGINVNRLRIVTCAISGGFAGLAGAFLPLVWFGGLVKEISAGRGFIALAAVAASGLNPLIALGATVVFGFSEAVAYSVAITPGVKETVPFYLVQMSPYILTIAALAALVKTRRFPKYLGKPYVRE
jgi:Uncharacterized ABC-type transport system, permease component